MDGIKKMEKCLIWVLGILALIWAILFGGSYFMGWTGDGPAPEAATSPPLQPYNEWMEDIN